MAKPNVRIAAELSQHALSTVTQTKQAEMEIFSGAEQSSDFHVSN